MVNGNEEDAVVDEVDRNRIELCSNPKAAYEVMKWAVKYLCLVYEGTFKALLEAMEQQGKDMFG